MVFHGEKCRHCRGNMSEPKVVNEGPKRGMMRTYCISCGHIEHRPPTGGMNQTMPQQQQAQMPPRAMPAAKAINPFQPILLKKYGP